MNQSTTTYQKANAYFAFNNQFERISHYLNLSTINNFELLSKLFNKKVDHNTPEGRFFWKQWCIITKTEKKYISKYINYKLKLVKQMVKRRKSVIQNINIISRCKICNKIAEPDNYNYYYQNNHNYYCNCKISDCDTVLDVLKQKEKRKKRKLEWEKRKLLEKLKNINNKISKSDEKIEKMEKMETLPKYTDMIPILKKFKEKGHYKITRIQATNLLNEIIPLSEKEKRRRLNKNHKPNNNQNPNI